MTHRKEPPASLRGIPFSVGGLPLVGGRLGGSSVVPGSELLAERRGRLDLVAVTLPDSHALAAEELADGAGIGIDLESELLGRHDLCSSHISIPFV
jgi:hypothetical protein